jgi:hypothetical protein
MVDMKSLARELFSAYLLPFEIIGVLLLVAVIGATVVARRMDTAASEDYVQTGDEPRTDPLKSEPDPTRIDVAEPAYKEATR